MSIDNTRYDFLQPAGKGYWLTVVALLLAVITGAYCAYTMEHVGHKISGMNNSVVWGLPHVFAISLILSASGALNGATLSSVFGQTNYKPWSRLSVVLAIVLLIGGLTVLVLDLGRPDRLFIAMTTYNFRSIFSWNIFLYVGFIAVGVVYLWMMIDRRYNRQIKTVGVVALIWRIVLTTGTGSIFGFLVGRSALDSALIAPLFIALSFLMGSASFILVLMLVTRWQNTLLPGSLLRSLNRLLFWCVVLVVYFSVVHHLTNLYATEHHQDEQFVLAGPLSWLFWIGHIGVGVLLPLWLLHSSRNLTHGDATVSEGEATGNGSKFLLIACCASLTGAMILVYIVVVGSQNLAQRLFPGKTVTASSFGDAGFVKYDPSIWEWGLGIGGVSLAMLIFVFLLRVLPVSPDPIEH